MTEAPPLPTRSRRLRAARPPGGAVRVPRSGAAALFLERQWLDRPRGRRLTAANLARFAEAVGGIQIDSINVIDRAHHLTLWNRFGPYDRAALDRMLYRDRVLVEYWAHAACFVPRSQWSAWRRAMVDFRTRHSGWARWLRKNPDVLKRVEGSIRERGPLGNADFREARPKGTAGWWNWKPATHALQLLFFSGVLTVHSRVHFQKRFDLAERVLPDEIAVPPLAPEAFARWHLLRSLEAMGFATEADLRGYLSYPMPFGPRKAVLKQMVASGDVVEVELAGTTVRGVARAEDVPALASAARRRVGSRGTALLAPFDSLLWHRPRVRQLFGFDYKIEVYTPGHKRAHGYYTLPLLHDGRLIGRVDAKNHRDARRLELRHVHFEDAFVRGAPALWGVVDRDEALAGLAEAAASLATFLGADEVTLGRVTPRALASPVRGALRAAAGS
jgi:uncharacterized protein YcaQ